MCVFAIPTKKVKRLLKPMKADVRIGVEPPPKDRGRGPSKYQTQYDIVDQAPVDTWISISFEKRGTTARFQTALHHHSRNLGYTFDSYIRDGVLYLKKSVRTPTEAPGKDS